MKYTWLIVLLLACSMMLYTGCDDDDDEITGLNPTPTPVQTQPPAPPTATPLPAATSTPAAPTATPQPRSFAGTCFNPDISGTAGYIEFYVYGDGRITGEIEVEYHCSGTEPPYEWTADFRREFETQADAPDFESFFYRYESDSPVFTQILEFNGGISGTSAAGTWMYHFQTNSHEYQTVCDGEGTWNAAQL